LPDGRLDRQPIANVGYARVGTTEQDNALQLDALAVTECSQVFEDRAYGAQTNRAGLRKALAFV